jgi:hypothetical protein
MSRRSCETWESSVIDSPGPTTGHLGTAALGRPGRVLLGRLFFPFSPKACHPEQDAFVLVERS